MGTQEENWTLEVWIYIGYTVNGDKLACVWRDANNDDLVYKKSRHTDAVIGAMYAIEVLREDGTTRARFTSKKFQEMLVSPEEVDRWKLASATAEGEMAAEKLERKLRSEHGNIDALTMREVREMLARRRGWRQRQAFIAFVLE